jgi:phosphate transport system permease protein
VAVDAIGWLDWQFLTSTTSRFPEKAGIYPALVGSVYMGLLLIPLALVLGIGAAAYLAEYAHRGRLTRFININIANLAGVPSVVWGLLGLGLFVQLLSMEYGTLLIGSLTMALLILPVIIISSQEAIKAVPDSLRQASYAMGATKWQTIRRVVLPQALPGILTGTILSLARALGETAPLIMIGVPTAVFSTPDGLNDKFTSMTMQLFSWSDYPQHDFRYGVLAAGVVTLLVVLLSLNPLAIYLRNRFQVRNDQNEAMSDSPGQVEAPQAAPPAESQPAPPAEAPVEAASKVCPVPPEDAPAGPVIQMRGANVWYGNEQALFDINMDVLGKSVTAIIGPSGCGKSTLLRCINRMNDLVDGARVAGSLLLEGQEVYASKVDPVAVRRHIGMVVQKPNPFPKSVYENIAFGLRVRPRRRNRRLDETVEQALRRAYLWDEVKDKLNDRGTSLSGGQQQRLCIARALAVKPEVLLMDEPCSALDPIATARIEDLILDLKRDYAIVIVTHNMHQAGRVGDYTAFLHLGKLIEHDTSVNIFQNPTQELTERYVTGRFG